ncbi:MAG: M949_RS01915 family surface polysaccharide biosynthesis protein [Nocardioides sp.]
MRNLARRSRTAPIAALGAMATLAGASLMMTDAAATGSAEPSAGGPALAAVGDLDSRRVGARATAQLFEDQGLRTRGTPSAAITWQDAGGVNYLLTTKETDPEEGVPSGITHNGVLRVYRITGLGSRDEKLGQLLAETNDVEPLPDQESYDYVGCALDGGIGFVRRSLKVTDADADGIGEVSVGWWRACIGDVSPAGVNLSTFTDGQVYTLSGEGSVRKPTAAEREAGIFPPRSSDISPVTASATPVDSAWPEDVLASATALFDRLYR